MTQAIRFCWEGISAGEAYLDGMDDAEFTRLFSGDDKPYSYSCVLPEGHDGPHEWTPDGDILINFGGTP